MNRKKVWRKMFTTRANVASWFSSWSVPAQPLLWEKFLYNYGFWEGIQERTLTLRFLGTISRVLRLEVSTIVFCLSTRCYSRTNLSFLHWLIIYMDFWNHRGRMINVRFSALFIIIGKCCLFRWRYFHVQILFRH